MSSKGQAASPRSEGGMLSALSPRLSWLRRGPSIRIGRKAESASTTTTTTAAAATPPPPANANVNVNATTTTADVDASSEQKQHQQEAKPDIKRDDPGEAIIRTLETADDKSFATEADRCRALREAYALISRVETPWETIARSFLGQTALYVSLKVLQDLKVFEKWHEKDGDAPMSTTDLAAMVGVDAEFLGRPLRHLASNNLLEQPETDVFKLSRFTRALVEPRHGEWVNWLYDTLLPCTYEAPGWLEERGYRSPTDPADGIFQRAKGGFQGSLFEYFAANPRAGQTFNHCMSGIMGQQTSWLEIYPHATLLEEEEEEEEEGEKEKEEEETPTPLLVDIGGSLGHDLERFRAAHPAEASRLWLQDLPHVVAQSPASPPLNKLAHDFFQAQPVRGARAYYLHQVLHDWPDAEALAILRHTRDAMTLTTTTLDGTEEVDENNDGKKRGEEEEEVQKKEGGKTKKKKKKQGSRLLIHDQVVTRRAQPLTTAYDVSMMQHVAGKERTEAEWRALLADAGLDVIKVWSNPSTIECIIEAVRRE